MEFEVVEGTKTWEATIIPGDEALSRLLGVTRLTVKGWREAGKISARGSGTRLDGRPVIYIYNWETVKKEVVKNKLRAKALKEKA